MVKMNMIDIVDLYIITDLHITPNNKHIGRFLYVYWINLTNR